MESRGVDQHYYVQITGGMFLMRLLAHVVYEGGHTSYKWIPHQILSKKVASLMTEYQADSFYLS